MMRPTALVVMVVLGCASLAHAQSDAIKEVERWRLNFTFRETGSYSSDTANWTVNQVASGSVVLSRKPGRTNVFVGTPTISVHYVFSGVISAGENCTFRVDIDSNASPDVVTDSASLTFFAGGYQFQTGNTSLYVPRRRTTTCPTEEVQESISGKSWSHYIADDLPYPASGTTLSGTYVSSEPIDPESPTTEEATLVTGNWEWTIVPDTVEELRLEIDESSDYEAWTPRANPDGSPGSELTIDAAIVTQSGRAPAVQARRWEWRLVQTSREPGIAMNFPPNASDTRPDLELAAPEGTVAQIGADAQTLERFVVSGTSDAVVVRSFDWGAWATLEVVVTLEDERTLTGVAKVTGGNGLRLPKRPSSSYIADVWKSDNGASGADDVDNEAEPPGDGTAGDGLSLYQEYRGFYENGRHVFGAPRKKDLFIKAPEAATTGVALFKRASGIETHARLRDGELPASRVINSNRAQGPGATEQHALVVTMGGAQAPQQGGTARSTLGQAVGGPGNPKMVSEIRIMGDWAVLPAAKRDQVVAHELLHGVNVWHHGEQDRLVAWGLDDENELAELSGPGSTTKIQVFAEPNIDVTETIVAALTGPTQFFLTWLGVESGQHAGHDQCVMRYFSSQAYVSSEDTTIRFRVQEAPGATLCTASTGTGVNEPGRNPQARYSDAAAGRGNCKAQVLVTDAAQAPSR